MATINFNSIINTKVNLIILFTSKIQYLQKLKQRILLGIYPFYIIHIKGKIFQRKH